MWVLQAFPAAATWAAGHAGLLGQRQARSPGPARGPRVATAAAAALLRHAQLSQLVLR